MRAKLTVARMWQDTVSTKFVDSLAEMLIYSQATLCNSGEFIYYDKGAYSWFEARNNIVENMKGDWLLQLDTDHMFAPDLLSRLLLLARRHDAQVLSGIYTYKHPPHAPVAGMWTPEGKVAPLVSWPEDTEVLQVGVIPGGNLLVHRDVFTRIAKELGQRPFDILPGLSEDYSFCKRCQQLNIPVYLAPNVECHHLITHPLWAEDYRPPEHCDKMVASNGVVIKGECD